MLALVGVAVGVAGLQLRWWAWDQTEPIRFVQDIDNAFLQGTRTLGTGYLERYDDNATNPIIPWGPATMSLDYGPGRLAIATLWTRWVRTRVTAPSLGPDRMTDLWYGTFYTRARELDAARELCRPLLMVNLTGEALAAVAMFLLVRRYASDGGERPVRGTVLAAAAASLFWLDPALVSNAHAWPQWDSWVLPFFLWAVLLASLDWWFCAGAAIAAGAMFKGQVLFGAPLLLLWPIFQGRFGAVGRWLAGLSAGAAAFTAVWLVRTPGAIQGFLYVRGHTNPAAVRWVIDAAVAAALVIVAVRLHPTVVRRAAPVGWAGWTRRDPSGRRVAVGVATLLVALTAAAVAWVGGLWMGVAVSVGAGLMAGGAAVALLLWTAWAADVLPDGWVGRVAAIGVGPSIAVRLVLAAGAVVAVAVPLRGAGVGSLWPAVAAVAGLAALCWAVPGRSLGHVAAAWVAAALLLCIPLFGGSDQWFLTGIAHGTTARNGMSMGDNNNLAKLLEQTWGWHLEDPAITLPPGRAADDLGGFLRSIDPHVDLQPGRPITLPLKYLLLLIWVGVTVACSTGAARHDRRRDPRFLLAVAAPWVAMFAVLGQMHQRYLLWGAALTCMAAAVSPGLVVLHVLLSVVSAGQELLSMAEDRYPEGAAGRAAWRAAHPELLSVLHGWTPGMGWAVLLTAGVFVYQAVAPGRRRHPPGLLASASSGRRSKPAAR